MKTVLFAFLMSGAVLGTAYAAEVTNKDADPAILVIVEGEDRIEIAIDPGATESICPSGCFITTPSGDRLGLSGGEAVEIVNGSAVVR